ncbi:hypothetical protein V6N13_027146 [Hibiscus sabdariffa]
MMRIEKEKAKASLDTTVADVWRRELGQISNRKFANRLAASEDHVLRLDVSRIYEKDQSCAGGVTFNAAGNVIVNGLADMRIAMCDWESGIAKLSFWSDGVVNHLIDDAMPIRQFIPLDHIAVDPLNPNLFAVSGSDKYTRLYDIRKSMRDGSTDFDQFIDHFYPPHLIGEHLVVVTVMIAQ